MTHAILSADVVHYLRGNRWLVQNGYLPKYHAVLCDPPYGLEFMGKEWDRPKPSGLMATRDARDPKHSDTSKRPYLAASVNKYEAGEQFQHWVTEWAELLLDYVHPGALLVAFGGTRTYHRLAAGLEDAGWEIADCIMWAYGSGFPKSHDISKAIDREAGATREVVGVKPGHENFVGRSSHPLNDGWDRPWAHDQKAVDRYHSATAPATPLAARWSGYGTALKPAYEPAVIARAPRGNRTYAGLAREFGTGALAIDAGRIGTESTPRKDPRNGNLVNAHMEMRPWMERRIEQGLPLKGDFDGSMGRWPANFGLVCTCESDDHAADCPVAVLGAQSGERPSGGRSHKAGDSNGATLTGVFNNAGKVRAKDIPIEPSTGDASRFFYTAKASAWEREAGLHDRTRRVGGGMHATATQSMLTGSGNVRDNMRLNHHPTIKPIRLAEYLARLLLPPELDTPRRLLVPFAGSGSEMIGALLAGWDEVTGIEREAEYVDLARARVGWWAQFGTYDEARKAWDKAKREKPAPVAPIVLEGEVWDRKHDEAWEQAWIEYGKREKPAQLGLFGEETA